MTPRRASNPVVLYENGEKKMDRQMTPRLSDNFVNPNHTLNDLMAFIDNKRNKARYSKISEIMKSLKRLSSS